MLSLSTTIVCLVLFVVSCYAGDHDWKYETNGTVTFYEAFNFTLPAVNLWSSANLTLKISVGVLVCIQERFPIPAGPQFSNETCTHFWNATESSTKQFELRYLEYNLGFYFADEAVTIDNSTNVTVTLTGNTCPQGMYYSKADNECSASVEVEARNQTIHVNTTVAAFTYFYVVNVPEQAGSLTIHRFEGLDEVSIRIRYAGNPTDNIHDVADVINPRTLTFNYPRPGPWVIAYVLHDQGGKNESLELSIEECAHTHASGPGCKTKFTEAVNDKQSMNITLFPNQELYIRYNSTKESPLYVSLTTFEHTNLPNLYVSRGNLPSKEYGKINADITNCNQANCDKVRSVYVNLTEPTTWFVWVVYEGTTNTTFGLWWNTSCAPDCLVDSRGVCQDGVCKCQIDYTGIDCSQSKGLGAQYIVLIIIASLVFASAIIGFVAWAYMRRKRNNYELVS